MAEYVAITKEEMEDFLLPQGFIQLDPASMPSVKELVYAKFVGEKGKGKVKLSLRIYTGINPNGRSREAGADAIRAQVFWRRPDGKTVSLMGAKRVHRVAGWRKNLQSRIDGMVIGPMCDKVHKDKDGNEYAVPMVVRKSANGEFYGCGNFPECRNTKACK